MGDIAENARDRESRNESRSTSMTKLQVELWKGETRCEDRLSRITNNHLLRKQTTGQAYLFTSVCDRPIFAVRRELRSSRKFRGRKSQQRSQLLHQTRSRAALYMGDRYLRRMICPRELIGRDTHASEPSPGAAASRIPAVDAEQASLPRVRQDRAVSGEATADQSSRQYCWR